MAQSSLTNKGYSSTKDARTTEYLHVKKGIPAFTS